MRRSPPCSTLSNCARRRNAVRMHDHMGRVAGRRIDVEGSDIAALLDWLDPPSWHQDALCRGALDKGHSPWFSGKQHERTYALSVCARCPVRAQCAAAATGETYGVWGGTDKEQRGRQHA